MSAPALKIPVSVDLEAFRQGMQQTTAISGAALRMITSNVIEMNAGFLATRGAAGAAALGLGAMLRIYGPLGLAITATTELFKLASYSIDLAKQKIDEFNATAEKAANAGVSTDFFQRFTKGGEALKLSVDDANAALDTFSQKSKDVLGGSDLDKRIKELVDAGNFKGNTGVAEYASATGTETKLRAIVDLINQAMQNGERLAALDLADRAFGPKIADNLRASGDYLQRMLQAADNISKIKIVSDEEIARAIDLKNRMEEAHKVLAEKWKPIQDDLAALGTNFEEHWIAIYRLISLAVGAADNLYLTLKQVPDVLAAAGNSSFWSRLTDFTGKLGLNAAPESMGLSPITSTGQGSPANRQLAALLSNPNAVRQAMQQATDVEMKVTGDKSKAPEKPAAATERDRFEAAADAIEKHSAATAAETQTLDLNSAARDRAKVAAQLQAAAVQVNREAGLGENVVTAEQKQRIDAVADAYEKAALALEKAKIASSIKFDRATAFLSPEDAAIAKQLSAIYGTDVPRALDSTEASALRMNEALKSVSQSISNNLTSGLTDMLTGTKNVQQGFVLMTRSIINSIEQMIVKMLIVQPLMRGIQGAFGFSDGGVVGSSSKVPGYATGGLISGPGTGTSDSVPAYLSNGEFVVRASATARHLPLLKAINGDAIPRFADGGVVGNAPAAGSLGGSVTAIAPAIAVTVQGNPGMSGAEHKKMGENIAKAAHAAMRDLIIGEIRTQSRPGGILSR